MGDYAANLVIHERATLEEALATIEDNRHRSVVVVGDGSVVVGILSDGDARKAILEHRLLGTPVQQLMNTNFISVTPDSLDAAGEIFEREHIFLIPVVDGEGRLLDVLSSY